MPERKYFNTPEQYNLLLEPGLSDADVAEKVGCRISTVSTFRSLNKETLRQNVLFTKCGEAIKKCKDSGMPLKELANTFNTSDAVIGKVLKMLDPNYKRKYNPNEETLPPPTYFPYDLYLKKEILASAKLRGMTETEYRNWIDITKEGERYFLTIQGTPRELHYNQ